MNKDKVMAVLKAAAMRDDGISRQEQMAAVRVVAEAFEQRDALAKAAKAALESDGGIHYEIEEDEIGTRSCCYVLSYKDHKPDCYITMLRAALARVQEREHE